MDKNFTDFEVEVAEKIDAAYKYVTRDDFGYLRLFVEEPVKNDETYNQWAVFHDKNNYFTGVIFPFVNDFKDIRADDEEPTLIQDIIDSKYFGLTYSDCAYLREVLKPLEQYNNRDDVFTLKKYKGVLEIKVMDWTPIMLPLETSSGKYCGLKEDKVYTVNELEIFDE